PGLAPGPARHRARGPRLDLGDPPRRRRGRPRRPAPHRLPDGRGAAGEAGPPVRPRPDGAGEPHRRGAGRQPAPHRGGGRPAERAAGTPGAGVPGDAASGPMTLAAPPASRPRILVVDDELGPRESLRILLKPAYDIRTADSARVALQEIGEFRPDLVVLDIKMPEMDGLEVLRRIKRIDPAIEVVMITAY